ncbi:MAG TPA: hypothetical protein VND66_13015 [Acidobacteriaceae bacterium]|nr:hypothetical protein [Acidobacteriaceae bacterium]
MEAAAQAGPSSEAASQLVQQAQTLHLPIHVFSHSDGSPIADLQPSDLSLTVDGKPRTFQLSRPWQRTVSPAAAPVDRPVGGITDTSPTPTEDRPNLLIIVPLASPLDRNDAINEAVVALKTTPPSGWNISILDDSGNQTAYTRQLPRVITELEKIGAQRPAPTDLATWRSTATLAIASMRDLPGRRVVLSLGDIFHEVMYQGGNPVYDNFEATDVSTAARNVGAVIYAAESSHEINIVRLVYPHYSTVGSGPWMLLSQTGQLAGWLTSPVSDTIQKIRGDGMAAYDMDLNLEPKQMDGLPHLLSVTTQRQNAMVDAPAYYIAPSLAQLQDLSRVSESVRQALQHPPSDASAPLQLATQLEYFPHPDGKTGTQLISTGLFWTKDTPPPPQLEMAQQLEQIDTGFMIGTLVGRMEWSFAGPTWNTAMEVLPGTYKLRVAAAAVTGKITAGLTTSFTVAPPDRDEGVRISSLVIGKACVFSPRPETGAQPQAIDYLRAGNCTLQLDPSHFFSPQDIVWTLVRITPVGKLTGHPSKEWKGSFLLVNIRGSKLAEVPIRWLSASDGSLVGTTAFSLDNPKLKLVNGAYAVLLKLKGPGIEPDYEEDAPFLLYGANGSAEASSPQLGHP